MIMKLFGLEKPQIFFEADGKEGGDNSNPEVTKHDAHLRQAITERDEAKAKARELEKTATELSKKLQEIEDANKMKTGEFEKLATEYKQKFEVTQSENERLKGIEETYNKYVNDRKQKLIETIPEDKREEWKNADLPTLEKVVPLFNLGNGSNLGMDSGKGGKTFLKLDGKSYKDFTVDELDEIKKSNPKEYDRLFSEKKKVKTFL